MLHLHKISSTAVLLLLTLELKVSRNGKRNSIHHKVSCVLFFFGPLPAMYGILAFYYVFLNTACSLSQCASSGNFIP